MAHDFLDLSDVDRGLLPTPDRLGPAAFRDDISGNVVAPRAAWLPIFPASSLANLPVPTRRWLVPDLIPDSTVTMLSGDGGVGKSLLALQLAVAVATGTDWIGTMPETGSVIYLGAEDDHEEIHRRLAAISDGIGLHLAGLGDLHIVPLAGKDAVLGAFKEQSCRISGTRRLDALKTRVYEIRPRLLVLDTLADVFAGNENSRSEVRQFVGLLRNLAVENRLAVVLLAHPSLTGINSGSGLSGSTAWNNSVRSRLLLDRPRGDKGDEVDPDLRVLRGMKANYARGDASIWLRWQKGRWAPDGSLESFNGVATQAKVDQVFLDLVGRFQAEGRDVSPNRGPTYAPAILSSHPDALGVSRKALELAMNRLLGAKKIVVEPLGPPSKRRSRIILSDRAV
jgi:RecA-family ATPase